MHTKTLIRMAGGVRALAAVLGVSTQAIYKWGRYAPPERIDQLRTLRPEWFV